MFIIVKNHCENSSVSLPGMGMSMGALISYITYFRGVGGQEVRMPTSHIVGLCVSTLKGRIFLRCR